MLYDLKNILDRERFKRRCNSLFSKNSVVELTEKNNRSNNQNRYLHLLLGYLAIETGNTLDFVKDVYYKRTANKDIFIKIVDDKIFGNIEYIRSSASLSKDEFSLSIDRLRDWSSQVAGIYLPSPNETQFLESIEIEMSKLGRWI